MPIAASLAHLQEEIADACRRAGRRPEEITLIAVSKTQPASAIREAHAAGIRHVGENRAQEIQAKRPELLDLDLVWHMIGHLQTNKVRHVLPHVGILHSVDRPALVVELAKQLRASDSGTPVAGSSGGRATVTGTPAGDAPVIARRLPVLIQVNTTGEETKSGVDPDGLNALAAEVLAVPEVSLEGLMTIGPLGGGEEEIRRAFAMLRAQTERLRSRTALALPVLSMGMSDDFRLAIVEGATHLRIGSRIFGARPRG